MVLLSIFFTRIRSTEGSSADCSLFILSLHALALHLAVKILLQIFLYEDLSTLTLHTSVGCISSRMPAGPHFVTQPILLSEKTFLIFDINHQQNTRRSDQIETIKTIMQTTRPRITWKVLPMAQVAILKKWSIRKDLSCELFYSELKRHNVSHYIYYLATDNIHIVLENDNTVLIKGLKKVVNVKFSRNTHLIETSYDRLKSEKSHFSNTGKILLKQEFSDGLQISMNIKDITIYLW